MQGIRDLSLQKNKILRTVFVFFFLLLLLRGIEGLLPYQLVDSKIFHLENDFGNWLYYFLGFNKIFFHNLYGGIILTILLFTTSFINIINPNRYIIFLFWILFVIYALGVNINFGHTTHLLAGIIFLPLCFIPRSKSGFNILWEGYRYFVCWMYTSAFILKIYNGAFFQLDYGYFAFKDNVLWIIHTYPDSLITKSYLFFLKYPAFLNIGNHLVFIMEGSFIIGFFTKKFDKFFVFLVPAIHILLYFFADVFFVEQCFLGVLFLSKRQWEKLF